MDTEKNVRAPEFDMRDGTLAAYHGPGGDVFVPEGTRTIGDKAFQYKKLITSVSLPEGVTGIGLNAFSGCESLTHIRIPASVSRIGTNAFCDCRRLSRIDISPDNPFYKNEDAVIYTKDGRTLVACAGKAGAFTIPACVERIETRAFWGCRELTEIIIPEGVLEIGDYAFSYCTELRHIAVPGSVERIGDMAFHFCEHLLLATLAPGVWELGDEVFMDCRRLACVSLPDTLTALGNKVFYCCERLLRVSIPAGITRIRERTFANCRALESISLPDTVTAIEEKAFYGCRSLKRLELPPRLTDIRHQTFAHCSALREISLPEGLRRIGDSAFSDCKSLEDLALPDGLAGIGPNAFSNCQGLTCVSIPGSVRTVGAYAFSDCTGLVRAAFPDGIESPDVFSGCTSLREYEVPPLSRRYRAADGVVFSRDGRKLIAYPPGRRCSRYDIPAAVTEVCALALHKAPAKVVFVPEGVETFSPLAADGTGDDDPPVATSRAALVADLGRPVYLGPVDRLPVRQRKRAVEGFLSVLDMDIPEMEPWKENYISYIRQECGIYEKKAWKNEPLLRLMMEYGMLRPETAWIMLRKFRGAGRTGLASELSDYLDRTAAKHCARE